MKTGARPRLVEGLLLRPPAEESVWLVEERAAVVTEPEAWRPCLAKKYLFFYLKVLFGGLAVHTVLFRFIF